MQGFKQAIQKILEAKDILIAGHINPDGDSIGSLLSLGLGLKQLGKRVDMVSADGVPKKYICLPNARQILRKTTKVPALAISVDCGKKELLGKTFGLFRKAKCILEIDHHEVREPFGDVCIVEPKATAVGELVYLLLEKLNVSITKDIAQNILTAIIVETNSFRLPNVRPLTFEICAELLKTGIDFYKLSEMVYWSKAKETSRLIGLCLSRCKFLKRGKIAWSVVNKKELKRMGARDEDADSVANEILAIKGVEIALFFREENKRLFRVNLRAKGKANVAKLAQGYGGGGHSDAAGCLLPKSKKSRTKILEAAKRLLA